MKRAGIMLAAIVVLIVLGYWVKGLLTSEEDRVRGVIHEAMDDIEQGRALGFADLLHGKYLDTWKMDRRIATGVILALRRRFAAIQINYSKIDVTVSGDDATVRFQAKAEVKATPQDSWAPLDKTFGQLVDPNFEVRLVKDEGEWLIKWAGHPGGE